MGSRDVWFGANGYLAYTTNKQANNTLLSFPELLRLSWQVRHPPFLTAHYTEVGWMFTMEPTCITSLRYHHKEMVKKPASEASLCLCSCLTDVENNGVYQSDGT